MPLSERIVTLIERKSRMSMDSLWLALCLLARRSLHAKTAAPDASSPPSRPPKLHAKVEALAKADEPFGMYQERNGAKSPVKNKISEN